MKDFATLWFGDISLDMFIFYIWQKDMSSTWEWCLTTTYIVQIFDKHEWYTITMCPIKNIRFTIILWLHLSICQKIGKILKTFISVSLSKLWPSKSLVKDKTFSGHTVRFYSYSCNISIRCQNARHLGYIDRPFICCWCSHSKHSHQTIHLKYVFALTSSKNHDFVSFYQKNTQ